MGGALVDLGKLTKPATVLIEKVSDAIGGIAKPWQIKRVARAESEAQLIRAEAQLQISDIQRRGLERLIREEGRNQENIESITAKAIPHLSENADPSKIEDDWLVHFFSRARMVSDEEMQTVWANILASEANNPGNFSKRAVELVGVLSKADANLFTRLCRHSFDFHGSNIPFVYGYEENPELRSMPNEDLFFDELTHLDALGLIRFDSISPFGLSNLPKKFDALYFGFVVQLEFPTDKFNLNLGNVILTSAGHELSRICGAEASDEILQRVLRTWVELGYRVSLPSNR